MTNKPKYKGIDHLALAVRDVDAAERFFVDVLGFVLVARRTITGRNSGMISAEVSHNGLKFVLCQGTEPESQVSRLIEAYGPGVAHIALAVDDTEQVRDCLMERGVEFDTSIIRGQGITQVFSRRDPNSGLSFEFIERNGEEGFLDDSISELFTQLEKSGAY